MLGESAPSKTKVCNWTDMFKRCNMSTADESRDGGPKTAPTSENMTKIQDMIFKDHIQYLRE